ncbi:hypothetical protein [Halorussus salinus]|uniref:hypothetical protein n=1 Tax=Halorussus salinus TaxID=1364935 RepID=UPI001092E96A|nr:hypothetical protein [Halorussus salinus]
MSEARRSWFVVFGGLLGLLVLLVLPAAFRGDVPADPTAITTFGLLFGASILYLLGGLGRSVGGFEWNKHVGLGNVCMGLQMVVRALAEFVGASGDIALVAALGSGLGGLTLAYMGLDWFRGGRYFDLSAFEESPTPDESRPTEVK